MTVQEATRKLGTPTSTRSETYGVYYKFAGVEPGVELAHLTGTGSNGKPWFKWVVIAHPADSQLDRVLRPVIADLATKAGELGEFCQALYPLIVAHADDFGRLQGDPFTVKHQCHPTSPRTIAEFMDALRFMHDVGLIVWFTGNHGGGGRQYIQIVNFEAHQQGLHKRTRSAFPRVPDGSGNVEESPEQLKGSEENLTEGNLREEKKNGSSVARTEPAILTFPTVGLNGASWALTQTQVSEWQSAFPGIDILAEARKALAWLHANPGRRKILRTASERSGKRMAVRRPIPQSVSCYLWSA
jgi:hypothetical protein